MKSKISAIEIVLLAATAFVLVFVGYAVYDYVSSQGDEPTEQVESAPEEGADSDTIESAEDLDDALEELESIDMDEELDVEGDIDEELGLSA